MAGYIRHAYTATGTDAGNGEVHKSQWNADHTLVGVPYVMAQSGAAQTVGAVTTEVVLATISFAGGELGPNGWLRVYTFWTVNNTANAKTARIRVGGIAGTALYAGDLSSAVAGARDTLIVNANSSSSQKTQISPGNNLGIGTGTSAPTTAAVNTSSAWDLVISGQKATAGDTMVLEAYQVLVCYGA